MFGSLILPTGVVTTGGGGGGGGGIHHHHHHHLSAMGSTPYHPTMSFPSRELPRGTKIRASSFDTLPRVELISKPNTTLNLYQILRIKQNASSLEIKSAYRKLAKQFHPDALPPPPTPTSSSSDDDGAGAGLDFMAIHNAYATLSDPTERARYDIQIQSSSSSNHTRFHTYSVDGNENRRRSWSYGMQTRRWETDQCW